MQGQANAWVRALEAPRGLCVAKAGDASWMRTLEACVRCGAPMLIGAGMGAWEHGCTEEHALRLRLVSSTGWHAQYCCAYL